LDQAIQQVGSASTEPADYVYFRKEDCAGFFRRIGATLTDLVVILVLLTVFDTALDLLGILSSAEPRLPDWYVASLLLIAWLYLTLLKRSRIRTPGYWVTGLRITNLKGKPPSLLLMTFRLAWWAFGPIGPIIDVFFMSSDDYRQMLRDKLMGTYVIRKDAEPAGTGQKTMSRMSFMGMMLMYPVVRPTTEVPGG
jgi:uncharacterized RDD family membrane protein YckC